MDSTATQVHMHTLVRKRSMAPCVTVVRCSYVCLREQGCKYTIREGDTCEIIAAQHALPLSTALTLHRGLRKLCASPRLPVGHTIDVCGLRAHQAGGLLSRLSSMSDKSQSDMVASMLERLGRSTSHTTGRAPPHVVRTLQTSR